MRRSRIVNHIILWTALFWIAGQHGLAQDSGFVARAFCDFTVNMGSTSAAVQCFEGARNADPGANKVYAFSPYFEFLTYTSDDKAFEVFDGPDNHTKTVKMRLALYDDTLKSATASWISQQTNTAVNGVLPLPISALTVTENNTGATTTLPQGTTGADTSLSLSPSKDIYFRNLSNDAANQLQTLIKNRQADFSFTYFYKTSSNALGAYTITYDDVHNNRTFNQLTGAGGVGLVTRAGVTRLSASITQSMTVTSYCEEPESCRASLMQDLLTLFTDKMHFQQELSFADSSQLATLNNLTIDPRGKDFEAATLNTLHEALKTSHDYNELNHKIIDAHLSGGYGPFKADGGFSSNDEVNKAIKETFDRDWSGNDWSTVPKTINVYQINGADFQGSTALRQVSVKATFSMRSFQSGPVQMYLTADGLAAALRNSSPGLFVLVPIGTVLAYAGPIDAGHILPVNWLMCDGSALAKATFPDLFKSIGTTYGDGRDSNSNKIPGMDFNLPDYGGFFLRGMTADDQIDRGLHERKNVSGTPDPGVGSVEADETGPHAHDLLYDANGYNNGSPTMLFDLAPTAHLMGVVKGTKQNSGLESRPKNKTAYFIIRGR